MIFVAGLLLAYLRAHSCDSQPHRNILHRSDEVYSKKNPALVEVYTDDMGGFEGFFEACNGYNVRSHSCTFDFRQSRASIAAYQWP